MALQLHTRFSEIKLMEQLGKIRDQTLGWVAVHFHLSDLLEHYQSEYQVKIAVNLIHDLLKNYEGGIYPFSDNSIVVLCFGLEKTIQEKLIFQLRYLYMDDPLAYDENGQENGAFCTIYPLKRHWKEFYELTSQRVGAMNRRAVAALERTERAASPASEEAALPAADKELLSASRLVTIERALDHADLPKVIRRQPICAVLPNMAIRRVFDELYIHISHLRQMLKLDVDMLSNRWLFKYLTHTLDKRVIALLRGNPLRYLDSPVSINLNVETLLSSVFTEFDASIKPSARVSMVIEIPVVDVFADMAAFILARSEVQRLGYRVCLDGLTVESFASIDRARLGCDLVKVQWNASVLSDRDHPETRQFAEAIHKAGTNRVILCRCDNQAAIEYGQGLGISLFQGRYLDSVLNPTAKLEN